MHISAQKIIDYCYAILSNSEFIMEDMMETDTGDAMLPPEETGYIVVECKRAINENNKRVCIPKAWITCEIIPGKKVAFEYPAGDEDIAVRVKNKEPRGNSWKTHLGIILYQSESYEEAVGYLQTLCELIDDNSNQQSPTDAVGNLTICGENSKDNSNKKFQEDAVGYVQTGENRKKVEDNSNQMEPVTPTLSIERPKVVEEEEPVSEPNHSLKLRIVMPKIDQKSKKRKTSEKKRHKKHLKEHSKHKVHKSKHRNKEQFSLTDNITKRSSSNCVGTGVGTASCLSSQSNCKSSERSPKSMESEISNSVHSVPETRLKNIINNSNSSKRILLGSLDSEKENSDGILSEDRQLLENVYLNIISYVQYLKKTLLEIKKSHLIALEHMEILNKIAAKYKIPLPPLTHIPHLPVTDPVERENKRNGDLLEEESVQDDEVQTQDDDLTENKAQATEQNDNTSEENLLEEIVNSTTLMESDSENQIYTDYDESPEDYLPFSPEVNKYGGSAISNANDTCTLNHPGPGKGLIQIGRNSRIYICAKGLERAKRTCGDVKQFARELFREAFTLKALRACSMNGLTRPALHYKARTVLQKYALKYGQDVGWDSVEPKELEQNLTNLLKNTRNNVLRKSKKLGANSVK